MSTKKTTTSSQSNAILRDPMAMSGYHQALGTASGLVRNPFSNPFYQQTLTQGVNNANAMNQTMQSNINANIAASGIGANSPAAQMMRTMGGYMGTHNQAGAFLNASNQAANMFGMGMNFLQNPLVTGGRSNGTSTETTSGLGTWLPQVAGAALGGLGGAASAGMLGSGKFASGLGSIFGSGAPAGNSMGGFAGIMANNGMGSGYANNTLGAYMGGANNISTGFGGGWGGPQLTSATVPNSFIPVGQ